MMTSYLKPVLLLSLLLTACGGASVGSSSGSASSSSTSSSSSSSSSGAADLGCIDAPLSSGYCLVWQDEFSGNQVDVTKWSYEKNCWGGGNNEAQCYVTDEDNVWVDGSYLHIKAIRENRVGPNIGDDDPSYNPNATDGTGTFSSGRIRSIGKGDWRYGRMEVRAKLPSGQGTWPAIWMLPTEYVYGGWASSGEIDIMEAVNLTVDGEAQVHGTLHYGDVWPKNVYTGEAYLLPGGANPADDFHTYAVEWEAGEIRWYVDDDHFATQTAAGWYSMAALDNPNAPFDQPYHLILNLAVGGAWAASVNQTGIDASVFPQEMVIDFVRVFQCTKNPETGKGCGSSDGEFVSNPGKTPPQTVDLSQQTEHIIYDGMRSPYYGWYTYVGSGAVAYQDKNLFGDYGNVAEITFNTNDGIGFFQSETPIDLSHFDAIEFDLRVVSDPRSVRDTLVFRADCEYPCSSGDVELGYPGVNVWQHYVLSLSELANAGLTIDKVNTPFVISPKSGNQQGVVLQVDNLKLVKN